MKKRNWLLFAAIVLCLAAFFGYQYYRRLYTDTLPPTICMDGTPPEVSVEDPESALIRGITACDDADGDVTDSIVVESVSLLDGDGTISVRYAAFDAAGNVAKATREARFTDYRRPRFTLSGPLIYTAGHSFDVLSDIGAEDVIDGDIRHRIRVSVTDGSTVAALGTHKVQFQVSNSLGDTVTAVFPVEVCAAGSFSAELTLTDYLIYLPKGAEFQAERYLKAFSVSGETRSLRAGLPRNCSLRTRGIVRTRIPGIYTVDYRVTYTQRDERSQESGREYTGYSKLIVVVEG